MVTDQIWNSLEIAKLVVGLVTPLVVAFIGYWISTQLKRSEATRQKERDESRREYEEKRDIERLEREARKEQIERRHTPHIELKLECQFLGVRNNQFLAALTVLAGNSGQVLHKFERVILRLRGIKDEQFEYREGREPQANFPHKIFETNLVPGDWNFIFIEPGVTQRVSLITVIPAEYTYVLAHVEFEYKEYWPHTAEAVFAVPNVVA